MQLEEHLSPPVSEHRFTFLRYAYYQGSKTLKKIIAHDITPRASVVLLSSRPYQALKSPGVDDHLVSARAPCLPPNERTNERTDKEEEIPGTRSTWQVAATYPCFTDI